MDAIENIIKRIEEDANSKIREYNERAEKEIEKIRKIEESRWEREKEKLEADGKREAETIKQMYISKAHLDGKKMLMNAREKVIANIIENILLNFKKYVDYKKYIKDSLIDAKNVLGEEFDVVCMGEDVEFVSELTREIGISCEVKEGDIRYGGLLAVSKDALKKVDYTVEAYVERNVGEIRKKIYLKLFGEEYA